MPFNQQQSFPCKLALRTTADGIRLFRYPVREIESLHTAPFERKDFALKPGDNPLRGISGELFDIGMEVAPGEAAKFGLRLHETEIAVTGGKISCLGAKADLSPVNGTIKLRILVDRTSIEVFANDGLVSMTSCFLPKNRTTGLELYARGGLVRVLSLSVTALKACHAARTGQSGVRPGGGRAQEGKSSQP